MDAKSRLKLFLEYKGITMAEFEGNCGFAHGYVNNIRRAPSVKACALIALLYPELSIEWLRTGRGDMIQEGLHKVVLSSEERQSYHRMLDWRNKRIEELEQELLKANKKIDELKSAT